MILLIKNQHEMISEIFMRYDKLDVFFCDLIYFSMLIEAIIV